MLKNYFFVAFRNFWRNKVFTLINILGLSIGISAILVIFLIVSYEFGFDRFEAHPDRIYRIVTDFSVAGEPGHNGGVSYPMGPSVRKELTGIDLVAAFSTAGYELEKVTVPDPKAKDPTVYKKQTAVAFADTSYCSLLGYTWLAGSPTTALSRPYQTVLTETNARLYFPNLNYREIIGRELIFADTIVTTVTGILKDLPQPTDFYCKTLISWTTLERYPSLQSGGLDNWGSTTGASQLFIKAAPGTPVEVLKTKMQALYRSHRRPEAGNDQTVNLQPLSDLHFNADYGTNLWPGQRETHELFPRLS